MISNDFYKIVDKSADAMIVLDSDGVIRYVNLAGMALFNMAGDDMVGKMLGFPLILQEPVDMYVLREFLDFVAVEMRMVEVEWKDEPSCLVSLRDVTWRVKYEEDLSRSRDELEVQVQARTAEYLAANQKLVEEIEERRTAGKQLRAEIEQREKIERSLEESMKQAEFYLDLMAHDIRNLNQIGIGYLELAMGSTDLDEAKTLMEKPLEAMINTSQLIDNVKKLKDMSVSDVKKETLKPVDLCNLLLELKRQYVNVNNRNVAINLNLPPICFVNVNDLVKDVFTNIIENAIKHSDAEKPLAIDISIKHIRENQKNYYMCSVEDNGPGIPNYLKDKIFSRFQRGNTKAHGKGLGLFLVKRLVEEYDGSVWVEDRVPGDYTKGVRFVILLPAVE
jgi:signal transduction histidine kinase